MKITSLVFFFILALKQCSSTEEKPVDLKWPDNIQVILDNTTLLKYSRNNRLPLYLWPAIDPGELSDDSAERSGKGT